MNKKFHVIKQMKNSSDYKFDEFDVHISNEQLAIISCGYVYIKCIRNMVNHASNSDTSESISDLPLDFMRSCGYDACQDAFSTPSIIENNIRIALDMVASAVGSF